MSKEKNFTVRASEAQLKRWKAALDSKGVTKTHVCTTALDSFAARVEKQAKAST